VVVFAGVFGASEVLPPAGCARPVAAKTASIKDVIANERKEKRSFRGTLIRCGLYQLKNTRANRLG
jgi:hypothetical protein